MSLEFFRRAEHDATGTGPRTLGVLPAAFNPPTRAHFALAAAALASVDEVLLVLPRVFPHKSFEDASFDQRLRMLMAAGRCETQCSIAGSERGLFVDIAAECSEAYGDETRLFFVCGRDAAERIIGWDYGEPDAVGRMLARFALLVAARQGEYAPPVQWSAHIHALPLPEDMQAISATDVRERIRRGESWEHLVPAEIVEMVREVYVR